MPKVLKARRVHNPKRKKRMTAKQIRFFGTKRQRAALRSKPKRRKNRARHRNFPARSRILSWSKGRGKAMQVKRHRNSGRRRRARRKNVGEILTASLSGLNPGRKKMARRRTRRRRVSNRRRRAYNPRRRRVTVHHRRRRRSHNPRVVVRYKSRRRSRVRGRRRNPGFLSGKAGKVVGVLGGAAITGFLSSNFVPAQFNTGIMGYFATGIVAYAQGKIVGKIAKSSVLGDDMFIGGLAYLALKVISDMVPSIAGYIPFKLGQIAPSSFYVPQVPVPGSMSSFMVPSAVPTMVAPPAHAGMGTTRGRRVGRMGY